jgi:peroxiredoxin
MKNSKLQLVNQLMKSIAIIAFFSIAILFFSSCSGDDSNSSISPTPLPGTTSKAPDFSLTSSDNKTVNLSDSKNKVVVIFFFGNECPSCKAAAPRVSSVLDVPYANRADYQILGLDQWDGNAAKVQSFKTITSVAFPLLLNASSVAANYKTTYDRLVVIDKSGNIAFSGTQGAAADIDAVKAKVDALLK